MNKFIQNTGFQKILEALRIDFTTKSGIELNGEQNKKIESNYSFIIEQPLQEHLQDLEEEITNFYEGKITDLKNKFKNENHQLSILLRKADETLFDEIDTNRDGELDPMEIGVFMGKLIKAKKHLENEQREKSLKEKTNVKYNSDPESDQQTQVQPPENVPDYEDINIHKYYLSKLSFTELKKIAKKHKISIPQGLKSQDKEGVLILIDKIIENIQSPNNLL